ncbi:hypothetical protein RhiirA1_163558 [Rhizophagus irregularis]|uniref:Uncharacterized protein n=1 Tax=Rhizophagus irregularis TaxID=588596 RepID=A0A2N0RVX8_9GLOM|nr:hypothetical protein RhiirA1_163558 [Rhizophagus irregularis]
MFGTQRQEVSRSNSAPPTQVVDQLSRFDPSEIDPSSLDPRLDPDYPAYFYANSRLDPRLPPPLYTPGQSWQLWAGSGLGGLNNKSNNGSSNQPPKSKILEKFRGLGMYHLKSVIIKKKRKKKSILINKFSFFIKKKKRNSNEFTMINICRSVSLLKY